MRTQVPACLMFPLVHLLCQIAYQLEDNFLLRKRDERGTIASVTLFNLTSDGIVRDSIFHDTKEAREKHILPVYHNKKEWHTAVLMTHFFRPPNSPAEDNNQQVQLLKVEQIIDQMTVWNLHRGGSIYLDLQMSRQQRKVKRSKTATRSSPSSSRLPAKRKASPHSELSTHPTKRQKTSARGENGHLEDIERPATSEAKDDDLSMLIAGMADDNSSDEEEVETEVDESSSATEILSNLIVQRTLKRSTRSNSLATSTQSMALCSVSSMVVPPSIRLPYLPLLVQDRASDRDCAPHWSPDDDKKSVGRSQLTKTEMWSLVASRETQDVALASLYAATVCSISRRTMGSVVAKILQVMEDDVKYTVADKFARRLNATMAVRLVYGIMCTQSGTTFLPRYMMSLATQLEWLFEGCEQYDAFTDRICPGPTEANANLLLRRLRRKLAVRLQLVGVIGHSKHVALTVCYRDRIVKTLFSLLATSVVSTGAGLSLFSWILDLIPVVNTSVLHGKQYVSRSLAVYRCSEELTWDAFAVCC